MFKEPPPTLLKFIRQNIIFLAGLIHIVISYNCSAAIPDKKYKILHVMSYHSPWRWTDDQFNGFKEGLDLSNVEYKLFQMDTKHESTPEAIQNKANQAKALIKEWKPDLIYTTDDDAQQYVTQEFLNSDIPFVFSGVNKAPKFYGFTRAKNVTGVLEQEHFVESVNLIKAIDPNIQKLAVVFDDAPLWEPVKERIQIGLQQLPNIEIVAWDTFNTFSDFQAGIRGYQKSADAVALLGIFNFADTEGRNVPHSTVLRWTAEHSRLPDFGFWVDRVHYGSLCAVTVSGREQGLAAGKMARSILIDGTPPHKIPFQTTAKGEPVISLARAQLLELKLRSSVLLSSQIITDFEWEK